MAFLVRKRASLFLSLGCRFRLLLVVRTLIVRSLHSVLIQHMILKCKNSSSYMHVSGIKMIGRIRRMQIHDYFSYFITKFLAGNSKITLQKNILLYKWDISILMVVTTAL